MKKFNLKFWRFFFLAKNACGEKSCENKGTCQTGFTDKGYRCLCPPEFKGQKCAEGKIVIKVSSLNLSCKETSN